MAPSDITLEKQWQIKYNLVGRYGYEWAGFSAVPNYTITKQTENWLIIIRICRANSYIQKQGKVKAKIKVIYMYKVNKLGQE